MSDRKRFVGLKERAQKCSRSRCSFCGGTVRVIERNRRSGLWGAGLYVLPNGRKDRGRVPVHEYLHECQKCGEAFYTVDQMDYSQKQTIAGTLRLYQQRLGYKKTNQRARV